MRNFEQTVHMQTFLDGKVTLLRGDCNELVAALPENSIDSVVCDPPYALVSIVKRFGGANAAPAKGNDAYTRASAGFLGKTWDTGEVAFSEVFWSRVLRVLKPGGHLVAFSGTRTYHRMAVAIEDAGFEIRDQLAFCYGSGFPKSHDAGDGWGSALKPAWEPICLARKTLIGTIAENMAEHETGAINIDGCRIESNEDTARQSGVNGTVYGRDDRANIRGGSELGRWPANLLHDGSEEVLAFFPDRDGAVSNGKSGVQGIAHDGYQKMEQAPSYADNGSAARFFYTAKADAHDRLSSKHPTVKPVDLMQWLVRLVTPKRVLSCPKCDTLGHGQKSTETASSDTPVRVVSDGLQAEGQSAHGPLLQQAVRSGREGAPTEALRVVRGDIPAEEGRGAAVLQSDVLGSVDREPAAGIHNQQVRLQAAVDAGSSAIACAEGLHIRASVDSRTEDRPPANKGRGRPSQKRSEGGQPPGEPGTDAEGGSRQAESSETEHTLLPPLSGENHNEPTCKNCGHRLEYRPGLCLDPFAGTGTTGEAAYREGMKAILIEREEEYQQDIARRMEAADSPMKRAMSVRQRPKPKDDTPSMFDELAE